MRIPSLTVLAFAATALAGGNASAASIIIDTLPDPLPFGGEALSDQPMSTQFTVPTGFSWTVASVTLNIGQGSQANMWLDIVDGSTSTVLATSQVTALDLLFNFVPTQFNFAPNVALNAGQYSIVSHYQVTGQDNTSFWDAGAGAFRIEGTAVPEACTSTLLLGVGSFGLLRRRRCAA